MALTVEDFRKRFPEFASVSTESLTSALEETCRFVSEKQFGCLAEDAKAYYMGHLVACFYSNTNPPGCGPRDTPSGAVSSVRVGNVATTFAVDESAGELGSTKYGRRFASIRKSVFPTRGFGPIKVPHGCC